MSELTITKKVSRAELELAVTNLISDIRGEIKNINEGGCGHFAFFVHKELKECGVKSRMLILDQSSIRYKKDILNNIINNGNNDINEEGYATSFPHCLVQVDNLIFDGKDLDAHKVWANMGYKVKGHYTALEMETALRFGGWNSMYDILQNAKMSKLIKNNFKHLKN